MSEAVLLYFPEREVHGALRQLAQAFPSTSIAFDTGGALMMNSQDRNPVFKQVPARMKWICDDPVSLEQYGLEFVDSRTFATPQRAVARTWPRKHRYGMRALRWFPPVRTYKLNLFRTVAA